MSSSFTALPIIQSFQIANYPRYAAGAQLAFVGSWLLATVQSLVILEISGGSGTALGIVGAIQLTPLLLLAPVIGIIADRIGTRAVLGTGLIGMALVAVAQVVLLATGILSIETAYALAGLYGLGAALEGATRLSVLGSFVPRASLPSAVSLNTTMYQLGRLLGPALAGLLVSVSGYGLPLTIGAVALGVFAVVLATLPALPESTKRIRFGGPGAVRFVLRNERVRTAFLVIAIADLLAPNMTSIATLAVTNDFGGGPAEVGLIGGALAIGTISGAIIVGSVRRLRTMHVVAAGVLTTVTALATVWAGDMLTYGILLIPVGIATMAVVTATSTIVQTDTPSHLRGRVSALFVVAMMLGVPVGSPIIGALSDGFGARGATLIAGCFVLALLGLAVVVLTGIRLFSQSRTAR